MAAGSQEPSRAGKYFIILFSTYAWWNITVDKKHHYSIGILCEDY